MDDNDEQTMMDQGQKGGSVDGHADPAQVQMYLDNLKYPTDKQGILEKAREDGADDMVMKTLEKLPDQQFSTRTDVSEALGKIE